MRADRFAALLERQADVLIEAGDGEAADGLVAVATALRRYPKSRPVKAIIRRGDREPSATGPRRLRLLLRLFAEAARRVFARSSAPDLMEALGDALASHASDSLAEAIALSVPDPNGPRPEVKPFSEAAENAPAEPTPGARPAGRHEPQTYETRILAATSPRAGSEIVREMEADRAVTVKRLRAIAESLGAPVEGTSRRDLVEALRIHFKRSQTQSEKDEVFRRGVNA